MGAPKPCLGFRSRTAAVHHLSSEGVSAREIGRRIGISEKNVIALEYGSGRPTRASETHSRTVVLPTDVLDALRPDALRRGITVNKLVREIVATIADDGMVDAVLDDGWPE